MDTAQKLRRKPPLVLRSYWALRALFMDAEGRKQLRQIMGYVLFEPAR